MSQATMGLQGVGTGDLDVGNRRRAIISSAVGNFVELYDFLIYGLFAAQIAANFFPKGNDTIALLQAFAIYGVGFFMRPIGAIVIGAYGDRHGRKNALVVTPHKTAATSPRGDCLYNPLRLIRSLAPIGVGASARVRAIGTKANAIMIATMQKGLKPVESVTGSRSCPRIPANNPVMA